jgi:hypothetical protein
MLEGGTGLAEQGADQGDCGIGRAGARPGHPGQAFGPGSPEEAEKEQFDLVIRLMGESQAVPSVAVYDAGEEFVTEVPAGHLDQNSLASGRSPYVPLPARERQLTIARCDSDQRFVPETLGAPEAVIEVGDAEGPSVPAGQPMHQIQQHHGIEPAGNGEEDSFPGTHQLSGKNVGFDAIDELAHRSMLAPARGEASR